MLQLFRKNLCPSIFCHICMVQFPMQACLQWQKKSAESMHRDLTCGSARWVGQQWDCREATVELTRCQSKNPTGAKCWWQPSHEPFQTTQLELKFKSPNSNINLENKLRKIKAILLIWKYIRGLIRQNFNTSYALSIPNIYTFAWRHIRWISIFLITSRIQVPNYPNVSFKRRKTNISHTDHILHFTTQSLFIKWITLHCTVARHCFILSLRGLMLNSLS